MVNAVAPKICEEGGSGMLLPIIPGEHRWTPWLRSIFYAFLMVYLFLAIAMIADTFVQSIEKITSSYRQKKVGKTKWRTTKVWNETVATLTLMALGSSAPEIALSVIDVFKQRFHYVPLGTSTIIGSASFNLLIIVAVCVFVVPDTRKIEFVPAFYVTAVFSVFAYLWMVFALKVLTPNVVDIWEALFTILMLPIFVFVSYKVEIFCRPRTDFCERSFNAAEVPELIREDETETEPVVRFKPDTMKLSDSSGICDLDAPPGNSQSHFRDTGSCITLPPEQTPRELNIVVERDRSHGNTVVRYRFEADTSIKGIDFVPEPPTEPKELAEAGEKAVVQADLADDDDESLALIFDDTSTEAIITVKIPKSAPYRAARRFYIVLDQIEGGVFDSTTDGGVDSAIYTVYLLPSPGGAIVHLDHIFKFDMLRAAMSDWKEQIQACIFCNGSLEEHKEASRADLAMHFVALPWKVMFAFAPPTSMYNGWATFYTCLGLIGLLSSIVSDMAEIFGCAAGVADEVTAITFVALGTSMPDLFASRESAVNDPTADASVVNVTGSNCVNVFLGLGMPWLIAAAYWTSQGRNSEWVSLYGHFTEPCDIGFFVQSRNLTFMVLCFSFLAAFACMILMLRRKWLGAELGGPFVPKAATSGVFILYWALWIAVCSWDCLYSHNTGVGTFTGVVCGFVLLSVLATAGLVKTLHMYKIEQDKNDKATKATQS